MRTLQATSKGVWMAKAIFQKNQRVWVESVGAWAIIEKLVPVWARGFDEPVRVTYDVGLGRDFQAHELKPEQESDDVLSEDGAADAPQVLQRLLLPQQVADARKLPASPLSGQLSGRGYGRQ